MTLEELRAEAKIHGYRLVKINPYVKLKPCTCGRKLIDEWIGQDGIFYRCPKCGRKGELAKTELDARIMWNQKVSEEE